MQVLLLIYILYLADKSKGLLTYFKSGYGKKGDSIYSDLMARLRKKFDELLKRFSLLLEYI